MVGWGDLRREPFRLLFPAAVLAGCVGIGHWLAYATGLVGGYSGAFHASMQVGVYLGAFVTGFLMTALPNFSGAPHASAAEIGSVLLLLAAQVVALTLERWVAADLAFGALLLFLVIFVRRRVRGRTRRAAPPVDLAWLPLAFLLGIVGAVLVAAGRAGLVPPPLLALGRPLMHQGFILPIVFGVGGFLIPRLVGRIDESVRFATVSPERARAARARRLRILGAAAALFVASFPTEGAGWVRAAYALRASAATLEFGLAGSLFLFPRGRGLRGILLWASLWLVVAGLWGPALFPAYRVALLHLAFIGGLSLMTFAVGAIVILTHAAPAGSLHRRQWVFGVVAASIALAVAARIPADFLPGLYFTHLASAAASWLVGALAWLAWCAPFVLRRPTPGAFAQIHEEAKRRIIDAAPLSTRR
jgi:uncharacterized protein involved in response to NO